MYRFRRLPDLFGAISQNPQCKGNSRNFGILFRFTVCHHPGKFRNLRQPAPIFFLFKIYAE